MENSKGVTSSESTNPKRLENFAIFFKNYMGVSAIVTAALPIPITGFKLIPTFALHTNLLSTYTSLFCFLILGYIFYIRHSIARILFTRQYGIFILIRYLVFFLPAILIFLSFFCLFQYHSILNQIMSEHLDKRYTGEIQKKFLSDYPIYHENTKAVFLMGYYLGIFMFAEAAFILMAMKEYLQDIFKITDIRLVQTG